MSTFSRRTSLAVLLATLAAVAYACGGQTNDTSRDLPPTVVDASVSDAGGVHVKSPTECFLDLAGPVPGPFYEDLNPKMGGHCAGTQAQRIEGVQKLVFLGDSITAGTPPTPKSGYYSSIVTAGIKQRFGSNVEVASCAAYGARTDDFIHEGDAAKPGQLKECFPSGVELKKTLIVMTMGGNDLYAWIDDAADVDDGKRRAVQAADYLRAALEWLKSPEHFPNGSYVIFTNTYDFTDTSAQLSSCPSSTVLGKKTDWPIGAPILKKFDEEFMRHAVATGSDMIFLLENFCGHGFRKDDPSLQCYRGENTPQWFDFTCIHPNPKGHAALAKLVLTVVDGLPEP